MADISGEVQLDDLLLDSDSIVDAFVHVYLLLQCVIEEQMMQKKAGISDSELITKISRAKEPDCPEDSTLLGNPKCPGGV